MSRWRVTRIWEDVEAETAWAALRRSKRMSASLADADRQPSCPTCGSYAPHLHPAGQVRGEVELCVDVFHLQHTNQNTSEYVQAVLDKRASKRVQSDPLASENDDWTGDPDEDRRRLVERAQDQL